MKAGAIEAVLQDPLLFAESILIEPNTGEPFRANYVQRRILGALRDHSRVAVRVSRQTGKTYAMSVIAIWATLSQPNRVVLVIAPDSAKVKVIFRNIDLFLRANPVLEQYLVRQSNSSPDILRAFSNGSQVVGFTTGTRNLKEDGATVRGQTADVVIVDEAAYLPDDTWVAINPIIQGGLYRPNTIAIISSTPSRYRLSGFFYNLFHKPELQAIWYPVHVPVTENPDFVHRVDELRAGCGSEIEWITEYLADFPTSVENSFFSPDNVKRCGRQYYYDPDRPLQGPIAIGVDWDKYSAGVNIVVVRYDTVKMYYEVAYREQVPKSDNILMRGVNRVIELMSRYHPEVVAVDRGYGEMQLEVLRMHARQHMMRVNIVGRSFAEYVQQRTANSEEESRVMFKIAAYEWLGFLIDNQRLVYPLGDTELSRELLSVRVKSYGLYGPVFDKEVKDHVVSALSLALWELRDQSPYWQSPRDVPRDPVVIVPGKHTVRMLPQVMAPSDEGAMAPRRSFAGSVRRRF